MGNTSGASDKFNLANGMGNCMGGPYPGGPDLVYAVTPAQSGMLTAVLAPTYMNGWLHVATACPEQASGDIACGYSPTGGNITITVAVTGGTAYYVVPDSYKGNGGNAGAFTLTLTLN